MRSGLAGHDEAGAGEDKRADAGATWTGLQSFVKKGAGDFLEKGKDALVKLQTVTAPMDQNV
jgi:hypothetical protein